MAKHIIGEAAVREITVMVAARAAAKQAQVCPYSFSRTMFTLTCVYTPHINSGLVNKCSCFGIHDVAVRHLYSSVASLNEYLQDIRVTEDVVVSVVVHS
jgi:hypothetical protein